MTLPLAVMASMGPLVIGHWRRAVSENSSATVAAAVGGVGPADADVLGGVEGAGGGIVVEEAGASFLGAVAPEGMAGKADAFGAVGDDVEGGVGGGAAAIGDVDGDVVLGEDAADGVVGGEVDGEGARGGIALGIEDADVADVIDDVGLESKWQ